MNRSDFIKSLLGASLLASTDSFSYIMGATAPNDAPMTDAADFATFGVVHLNNTDLEKAIGFWTKIAGMKLRSATGEMAEFGTEIRPLVVVHQSAKTPFQEGYSGLYHFAIHLPDKQEFAKALFRLQENRYSFSPIDHTMTKSLYLKDPDGITIEFALETPELFKRVITSGGLKMEASDGSIRSASARLDENEVLKSLKDKDLDKTIHPDAKIGHVHFYAQDVTQSNDFYKKLGFLEFNYLPEYQYADLGAGGAYRHRVALNSWHGRNRPLAPAESAGLRHYQIVFESAEKLTEYVQSNPDVEKVEGGYNLTDPTGNVLFLGLRK
ncbi:MAG: VOC family protein [Saprospiraceae bacterium]|nr:VOC family protein [Saprospiraceae bacterium]